MPDVKLPFPEPGQNDKETIRNLTDTVIKLRKELEFLLGNLDEDNVIRAQSVIAAWIYAGTIIASQIQSGTLTLTGSMTITNTAGTVTITSTSFTMQNATGTVTITPNGIVIDTASVYISLTDTGFTIKLPDNSIVFDTTGLTLENGQITIKDSTGASIVIDKYGINPTFLRWFSNIWANSEFIWYDSSNVPMFSSGSGVTSSTAATFIGQRSLKITAGSVYTYAPSASYGNSYQNPQWFNSVKGRISFWSKGGQARFKLKDFTSGNYITLTKSDGTTANTIDFPAMANWDDDPHTCAYDVSTYTDVRPEITNIGATDLYINAPQNTVDKTGKWAQFYIPGKYAVSTVNGKAAESLTIQSIYIQDDAPSDAIEKDIWIDTNDYTRYDATELAINTVLNASANEVLMCSGTITITLHVGTTAGIIKKIYNTGTGVVTIVGTVNGEANMLLYPNESVELITDGTNWRA